MRLLTPSKGLIGVDITSATVKLLELKQSNDNFQVESYAVRPCVKAQWSSGVSEISTMWPAC